MRWTHFNTQLTEAPIALSYFAGRDRNSEKYISAISNAMKGKGKLTLQLTQRERLVFINISDTGKGIPKSQFNTIFNPGFTTKKRGWGLGLSLSRRIIEDYHNGKIKVFYSELNKGTTMQIVLKTVS